MKKAVTLLIAVGAVVSLSAASFATVIHVPADQPTSQAGINAAIPGDTVLVADGTYTGPGNRDIDFGGKGIVLKSENGADSTIIDCQGSSADPHRGFYFHGGEDSTAVVDGFTIQGGYGLYDGLFGYSVGGGIKCDSASSPIVRNCNLIGNAAFYGGGIFCWRNSNLTIVNNTISGNRAAASGGGIQCQNSHPVIINNTINGNTGPDGGGIHCQNSHPTIISNIISGNTAYKGSGINCHNSNPTISDNLISDNSAEEGGGGGIFCGGSFPSITHNIISGNSAQSGGGGIGCVGSDPLIRGNTISGNSGSGVYLTWNSSPPLENCIIAFSGELAIHCSANSIPVLTCCDVYGNSGGDWVGSIADQAGINGNFSADPLFCDTANGDFHIFAGSQCAPANNSCGVLIGALGIGCICGDANGDSLVTLDDVAFLQAFYFDCSSCPDPLGVADLNCDGSVDIADIVYLAQFLNGTGPEPCCW